LTDAIDENLRSADAIDKSIDRSGTTVSIRNREGIITRSDVAEILGAGTVRPDKAERSGTAQGSDIDGPGIRIGAGGIDYLS
jgi:hypothetical protein